MRTIWLFALFGGLAFGISAVRGDELVARFAEHHCREAGPSAVCFMGNGVLVPLSTSMPPTFRVYRTDEINELLAARDAAIATRGRDIEALRREASMVRRDAVEALTGSLKAQPGQLLTEEIKQTLVTEIATRLQASIDARVEAMKPQIEAEIMAKVERLLQSVPR